MAYAGAAGNTKSQMRKALFGDWDGEEDEKLHSMYGEIMQILNKPDVPYELRIANRIYTHAPALGELLSVYKNIVQQKYMSAIEPLDFSSKNGEDARGQINQWVSDQTNKKILEAIPSGCLSGDTGLVLVNAIYFKGDWKTQFDVQNTGKEKFYVSPDQTIEIDMMSIGNCNFYYTANKECQVLGMPYKGKDLFMFILLPSKRFGLEKVLENMTGKKLLETLLNANWERELDCVVMPKFKFEKEINLAGILQNLGATDMFQGGVADFSDMNGKRNLFVSDVMHKALIEVNEKGTEAVAFTGCRMMMCSGPINPSFVANHPFLFTIVHMESSNILFLGRFTGKD
jgi:serpin B